MCPKCITSEGLFWVKLLHVLPLVHVLLSILIETIASKYCILSFKNTRATSPSTWPDRSLFTDGCHLCPTHWHDKIQYCDCINWQRVFLYIDRDERVQVSVICVTFARLTDSVHRVISNDFECLYFIAHGHDILRRGLVVKATMNKWNI